MYLEFITHFGSVTLLLPLAFLLTLALWRYEGYKAALTFLAPLTACLTLMLLLKLYFISCGTGHQYGITSPSGHTAASTFVFGSIAVVMASHVRRLWGMVLLIAASAFIAAIAVSRVVVNAHTAEEVVAGFFVGSAALLLFVLPYLRIARRPIRLKPLLAAFLAIGAMAYGVPSSAEHYIKLISQQLRAGSIGCGDDDREHGTRA